MIKSKSKSAGKIKAASKATTTKKRTSQYDRVEKALSNYKSGHGLTYAALSRIAKVPTYSLSQRLSELRDDYNLRTNYHVVKGKKTAFYKFGA